MILEKKILINKIKLKLKFSKNVKNKTHARKKNKKGQKFVITLGFCISFFAAGKFGPSHFVTALASKKASLKKVNKPLL